MDRDTFFASVRASVFAGSLKQSQVDGLNTILDEAGRRGTPLRHLAYILATVLHETESTMRPVEEKLTYATAERIKAVWPSRFPTLASAKPYVRNPRSLAEKVYGGRDDLGNTKTGDGWLFRGRGLPQITGRANYAKFGIEATPDDALKMPVALRITFDGMTKGMFTRKKLKDFITPTLADYYSARAIVNGDTRTNGAKIATHAKAFEAALVKAGYDPSRPVPAPSAPVAPAGNLLADLIRAILSIFKRG